MVKKNIKPNFQTKLLLIIIIIITITGAFLLWYPLGGNNILGKKLALISLQKELLTVPKMKVDNYSFPGSGEGEILLVHTNIEGKGPSSFLYDSNGLVGIENINNHKTWYDCFYINSVGKRISYAGVTSLSFKQNSPFNKWFSYEIKNLRDLVDKYDSLLTTLNKLPKNPISSENMKKRVAIKEPDSNYVIITKINNRDATCDFLQFE